MRKFKQRYLRPHLLYDTVTDQIETAEENTVSRAEFVYVEEM